MSIDVYADVVFLINFVINGAVLGLVWLLILRHRGRVRIWRIFAGGAVSALFYTILLFTPLRSFLNVFTSFIILTPGVITAFGWHGWRTFGINLGVSYICAFALGGLALVIMNMTGAAWSTSGYAAGYASLWNMLAAILLAFGGAGFARRHIAKKAMDKQTFKQISISLQGKSACITGLLDTGMSLVCPISQKPVVVAELKAIKQILPEEILSIYNDGRQDDLDAVAKGFETAGLQARIRLIPFKSIGAPNGVLMGFRDDNGLVVGICDFELTHDGEYQALINPLIIGGGGND
ncbi:MAG: sigma-E processing peptidase SpoIIGA [Defluviitaleaceae bacterium]|nr:sigma-E processing peptidase SpoIIGA [Defluviitaleaceae bacterium]